MPEIIREGSAAAIAVYVVALSLAGFVLMGKDKGAARKGKWRIPEKTLLLLALLGGSPGIWLGMRLFHHKTRHGLFRAGVPLMMAGQLLVIGWVSFG